MTGANPIAAEESPKIFCLPPRTSGQLAFKNNGQTTPESIRKVLPDVIFPSDELVRVEDGIAYFYTAWKR